MWAHTTIFEKLVLVVAMAPSEPRFCREMNDPSPSIKLQLFLERRPCMVDFWHASKLLTYHQGRNTRPFQWLPHMSLSIPGSWHVRTKKSHPSWSTTETWPPLGHDRRERPCTSLSQLETGSPPTMDCLDFAWKRPVQGVSLLCHGWGLVEVKSQPSGFFLIHVRSWNVFFQLSELTAGEQSTCHHHSTVYWVVCRSATTGHPSFHAADLWERECSS